MSLSNSSTAGASSSLLCSSGDNLVGHADLFPEGRFVAGIVGAMTMTSVAATVAVMKVKSRFDDRRAKLAPVHNFFWMETTSPSGAATAGVRWLNAREEKETTHLFDRFFPDSYAQPGRAGMRRWAGVVGEVDSSVGTKPLAVAADAWSAAGCGVIGGVLTHPAARGRGLARAVSGFVVDALVRRHGRAALMVLTANVPAIATYERLGVTKRLFGAAHLAAR
ncbi:GNAT family N-acetyltransferase [Streptomyces sp. NPDC058642]|uniref:GNAT family N-acetyltransferase n=1 Tax=Streptomyces sp. NPDC058642 TaxID=3346572 RepID=UPI00364A9E31